MSLRASDGDTAILLAGRYQHTAVFDRLIAATDSTLPLFFVADQAGLGRCVNLCQFRVVQVM